MFEEQYIKKFMTALILVILLILSFLVIKPILIAILGGLILAFIFSPVYTFILKYVKIKDLAMTILTFILILIIVIPVWFLTPMVLDQGVKLYLSAQTVDFVTPLKKLFPSLFSSEDLSRQVALTLSSFISKTVNSLLNEVSQLVFNFPTLLLQFLVLVFTFYFAVRDKDNLKNYLKAILPFPKEVEEKIFKWSKDLTFAIIYGDIVVGIIQGLILSVAFFIFGVPHAVILSILAVLVGVLPILGPMLVWGPAAVLLLISGNSFAAIGIVIFGVIASAIDNFLRPLIVSRRTDIHPSVALVGMIGGLFFLGVVGLILGPLILAYLIIVLEAFKNKKELVSGLISVPPESKDKGS